MDFDSPIYVFTGSTEGQEYIAREGVKIALSVDLIDGNTEDAIVGPYALFEQDWTGSSWPQFRRAELRLELGQYLTEPKLTELKSELWPLIKTVREGYLWGGYDENGVDQIAEFTDSAEEAIQAINDKVDEFQSEFDAPPHPEEAREDGFITTDDVSADSSNSELEEVARSLAEQSLARMHSGDTLFYLQSMRDALRGEM